MTLKDLGIRTDNLKGSVIPYTLLTIFLVIGSSVYINTIGKPLIDLYYKFYPSIFVVIGLSIFQELVFRGYLMFILRKIFKNIFAVVSLNAIIFTIAHTMFPNPYILLPGAFLIGIAFAFVYYYYPNLLLASSVHLVVNLLPLYLQYRA